MVLVVQQNEPVVISGGEVFLSIQEEVLALVEALSGDINLVVSSQAQNITVTGVTEILALIEETVLAVEVAPSIALTSQFTLNDVTDSSYYYYGGLDAAGEWKVNRWTVATLIETSAQEGANPSYMDLGSAWTNRLTLTYS